MDRNGSGRHCYLKIICAWIFHYKFMPGRYTEKGVIRVKRLFLFFCLILVLTLPVLGDSPEERDTWVKGYVALTFDDGPSGKITEMLLDGLREKNARATFFLCGYRMDQYPETLDRYLAEGHELGVHSTVHQDLTKLEEEIVARDMEETSEKIWNITGKAPVLMRPPGGAWNETVCSVAKEQGLSVILWSVDSRDWALHESGKVLETVAPKTSPGDIILMHDMTKSSVQAALQLVDRLQRQGYVFVTVSELALLSGSEPEPGQVYRNFSP